MDTHTYTHIYRNTHTHDELRSKADNLNKLPNIHTKIGGETTEST